MQTRAPPDLMGSHAQPILLQPVPLADKVEDYLPSWALQFFLQAWEVGRRAVRAGYSSNVASQVKKAASDALLIYLVQGSAVSMIATAQMYLNEHGYGPIKHDHEQGILWMEKAASRRDPDAIQWMKE